MKRDNKAFASDLLKDKASALGSAIASARLARNITRQDFSERANMSPSTLVRIERGDVSVNFLAWLQAMERAGILGLLDPASNPHNDVIGEVNRKADARRRARKPTKDQHDY
ncbi:multiprotein-bridging factor 1 family protein [Cupriavidus sp. CuC1]|uniref:multiprotein-bridging factor 1 family protein n=1 Tax=Cupriavidus sp. CuC1 TaxID=3373131 RepID=UPI0037D640F8